MLCVLFSPRIVDVQTSDLFHNQILFDKRRKSQTAVEIRALFLAGYESSLWASSLLASGLFASQSENYGSILVGHQFWLSLTKESLRIATFC